MFSDMFNNVSNWTWIALAYGEVVLAYLGYLVYLGWRERRARREDER